MKRPATCRCRSAGRSDSAIGEHPVQLGVPLVDTGLHAAAQPRVAAFEAVDSDWVRSRVRPSPRSSNHSVSSATPSGSPSNVNVCTIRSGRTSWKQPRNAYSPPSRSATYRQLPPVRASQCSIRVVMPSGPTHRANNAGSVWARNSCPGVAAKSRVIRMTGSFGSASMTVSVILFILVSSSSPPGRRPGGGTAARRGPGGARSRCPSGRGPGPPGAPAGAAALAAG